MNKKTKTYIRYRLRVLGQNFLRDRTVAQKIAKAGAVRAGDLILEIGPGEGILTAELLAAGARVVAVEKDKRLCEFLREKFAEQIKFGSLVIICGDILKFDFKTLKIEPMSLRDISRRERTYKLIANIPYYITGLILRKFLTANPPAGGQPSLMVLMLQKEVAERIVAKNNKESLLSISVKAYGEPKILFRVGRGAFRPAPKVDSAVLEIKNISRARFAGAGINEKKFFKILRAGFAHPRKKLTSNLATYIGYRQIPISDIGNGNARAEEIPLEKWLELAAGFDRRENRI